MSPAGLTIEELRLWFGGMLALDDVTMHVARDRITGVIGPNGAGKTSLLNCVNGFYRPAGGRIAFDGRDLAGLRPHERAVLGLGRTFQGAELCEELSVIENVAVGCHAASRAGALAAALRLPSSRRAEAGIRARADEIVEFLELGPLRDAPVGSLSNGQRKLVDIGRALATSPSLLMLDEPTAGMQRDEKDLVVEFMLRIHEELGTGIVLIEHDLRLVSGVCDEIFVLDFGRLIGHGPPSEVLREPAVVEAYVGTDAPIAAAEHRG